MKNFTYSLFPWQISQEAGCLSNWFPWPELMRPFTKALTELFGTFSKSNPVSTVKSHFRNSCIFVLEITIIAKFHSVQWCISVTRFLWFQIFVKMFVNTLDDANLSDFIVWLVGEIILSKYEPANALYNSTPQIRKR